MNGPAPVGSGDTAPETIGEPVRAPDVTVDRVGPSGGVASDSAFGVALVSLWQRVAEAGGPVGFPQPVTRSEVAARAAGLVAEMRTGRLVAVAANRARRLIGVAILRPGRGTSQHTGRIELLLVDPAHTAAGLGTRLMTDLLALARERGLLRLDLEVQDGAGLGEFFTRFGFAEWGRRPGWIRPDANDERDEVVLGVTDAPGTDAFGTDAPGRNAAGAGSRRVVDLSHVITDGMVTYPGIPGPAIGSHLTFDDSVSHYAAGTEFSIGTISMAANTGTYLDTPAHRYRGGEDLAELSLGRMVDLDGVVARARVRPSIGGRAIDESDLRRALDGVDLTGTAVLIDTGHSVRWGTPDYFTDHPYLTDDAAEFLVSVRPALVGIDSLNIDSTHTGRRPAHSWLLAARIPVVEHLTGLDELPDTGFRFTAAPPAIRRMGTFPVRAFAIVS